MSVRVVHRRARDRAAESNYPRKPRCRTAANPFQMFTPKLPHGLPIEEVGTYAVRINWNDGHNTGIYSFEHLRDNCPCAECVAIRRQHSIES